ncbi:MAG TPA: acyl-CoA thioesterase [Pseudonocardia sp.]|nr:acyl-CoA thioesterase [Pseudonocardia sp.]
MGQYVAQVPLRWTDQDSYRHLNNASVVTLLEEARIGLFFEQAAADGLTGFAAGLLVAGLHVDYRRQVGYRAHPVRVAMSVDEVRAAAFRVNYELHDGPAETDPVAVTAWTRMATFDLNAQRLRRLVPAERAFLHRWAP